MFFLGSTGPILPYIISLIAIWSGFLLGYGRIFSFKTPPQNKKELVIEKVTHNYSENSVIIFPEIGNNYKITNNTSRYAIIQEIYNPSIFLCYGYRRKQFEFDENPYKILSFDISPTRGPPPVS